MIVGPTVLIVSIGTGAPARIDSSNQMNCSTGVEAATAVLLGPPHTEPAVGAHLTHDLAHGWADALRMRQPFTDRRCQQVGVVRNS